MQHSIAHRAIYRYYDSTC